MMKKLELVTNLIEGLSATLEALDDHGLTVEDVAKELEGVTSVEAARAMYLFEQANELADTLKKTVGKVYDWSRMALVPNTMEAEGLELLRIEGVGRVSLTADLNVKVLDKEKQYQWLEEVGAGDVITETVNASTLKALLRRRMRGGEEVPSDIFEIKGFTRASITKS